MHLQKAVLFNPWVRLEPLAAAHREDLRAACDADPETWARFYSYSMAAEHFDPEWERRMADTPETSGCIPFAVMTGGRCVGMSRFLAIDPDNAAVEIGGTYYAPDVRGGAVNPAAKRLLLEHAFAAGARRVEFRVDSLNARSRAAVLKLGAHQDGILRQDRIVWTGRIRNSVVFSILADEWPAIREQLDARLAAF